MQRRQEEIRAIRKRQARNDASSWQWRLTFCGQRMGHNYYTYYMVDQIMFRNPEIRGIVEIGTAHGALTIVLGLWGVKLNIPVLSIDHNEKLHSGPILEHLGVKFVHCDENSLQAARVISGMCRQPVFIYCDGGDKPAEFKRWAQIIPPGSVIAAHDWGVEIGPEDVDDIVRIARLRPFMPERWERMNMQLAIWQKPMGDEL